ncbi:MAG: CehA/McbA family metallohydrolase [Cyclobacteriaceae bacterium]|nr:CehA/McbA family metallohydrolase [Cyclobacteriaceae bacterium]
MIKHLLPVALFFFLIFQSVVPAVAHPGHTDPELEELNDYLMAIQVMRRNDPRAVEIFSSWQELRAASWKIRTLTDDENLLINASIVMDQISKARARQKQLLQECRDYFAELIQKEPAIHFNINDAVEVVWENPLYEVQVQHSNVLLVEISNQRQEAVSLDMRSKPSDDILFWNKRIWLEAGALRYTFVVLYPYEAKASANTVTLADSLGNKAEATLRLQGIPMQAAPLRSFPGKEVDLAPLSAYDHIANDGLPDFDEAIRFNITDAVTGKPLQARLEVTDENDNAYWSPLKGPAYALRGTRGMRTTLWKFQPGPYFYVGSEVSLGVSPEGKTARVYHGYEYKPITLKVPENGQVDVALERWIDMPGRGWYSGHTHIHTTDAGMPVQFTRYWPLVSQAEDLHVSAILTLKGEWNTHAIYADEYPMGVRKAFSTDQHIITYGEEYRNNPLGHLAFLGLDYMIQPISSGALGELAGPDYPPNAYVLQEALDQGATTIGAHFGNFITKGEQIKAPWPSTGFEMPVDVALGKIQLAEIYGNGGQQEVWYDLLNCGFRVMATAGPDWHIKDTPRVYVNLEDKPFTMDNWRAGLQAGRSFITKGPMIFFEVNGQQPGSEINVKGKKVKLNVKAQAVMPEGSIPVEIVYNGKVIKSGKDLDEAISIDDSGWLVARGEGVHSNPVFINVKGRPAGYAAPARKFIAVTDQFEEWVKTKGLYDTPAQQKEALDVLEQGRQVYRDVIERAERLGRKD